MISTDSRGHRGVDTRPGAHGQRVAEPGVTPPPPPPGILSQSGLLEMTPLRLRNSRGLERDGGAEAAAQHLPSPPSTLFIVAFWPDGGFGMGSTVHEA